MSDIFTTILAVHNGDRVQAGLEVGKDLMQSNPDTCKVGYTADNAALAVQTIYGLTDDETNGVLRKLEQVAV